MGHFKLSKFVIILFYLTHSLKASDDRISLLSFLSKITSDPNRTLSSWNASNIPICEWSGVTCNTNTSRVERLILTYKHLTGTISPALFNLSQLITLDLTGNFFQGRIPSEIGSLYHLTELSLFFNLLEGEIPPELAQLNRLTYLNLALNKLTGEIPTPILCNTSASLRFLDLSNNSLSGEIALGNQCELRELTRLLLWSNRFTGKVPSALSNSSKMLWFDLGSNLFTGELPSRILSNMPSLVFLYLSYNHFSSHDDNTNLKPFFASLLNASYLEEVELTGNRLGGELPSFIGNLSSLTLINLNVNLIHGLIPPQLSNLVNLTLLNLSGNLLNGSIPSELCRMGKLERVFLSQNSLSGHIPPEFGNMPHLGLLDLSKNELSGSIPDSISNLLQIRRLYLHDNVLSGIIPPSLGKCVNLEILDLSNNRISGMIPSEVGGLSGLTLYLNLSTNLLQGLIPFELSKMNMALAIDLSSNNLSGFLPSQLGSCVALEFLNLSRNGLEGPLPESIGKLPYLQQLDVSFNRLTGQMPRSLQRSSTLKLMNFSYNNFLGNITNEGSFSWLTVSSFLGNDRLCGSINGLPKCKEKQSHHLLIAILLSLLITPVFCIVGYPLVSRTKLKRRLSVLKGRKFFKNIEEDEGWREEQKYPRISRDQLTEATGGFSDESLIGTGRFGQVYKGILPDDTKIAVKVLNSKDVSWSFKRECQVLRRIRHRNLMRILTTCSKPDFKAIVLPLMTNGSLENYLYPKQEMKNWLGLIDLVRICSDVAEGMAYLHHHAPVRVVHCDLKPSNILLDDDMTALVTDFGIAKLLKGGGSGFVDDSVSYQSTGGVLCGSFGYIAPEYGMGRDASTQGDVYSFGVVLLEIVTGKRPTDVLFGECSSMHEWVRSRYPDRLGPIIEDAIARHERVQYDREEWGGIIKELIELGLMCTDYNPDNRPTMVDVAHGIGRLKEYLFASSKDVTEQASKD